MSRMKKIEVKVLRTPDPLLVGHDRPLKEIEQSLNAEITKERCWTDKCSNTLLNNVKTLFLFDRMEYYLGNAFGHHKYKQALNPLMIKCHHPKCIQKNALPRKLRHMFDLSSYLDHLKDHCDRVGEAMLKRFTAVHKNNFINKESLDEISISPADLIGSNMPLLGATNIDHLETFGINRQLQTSYICHWKDKLLKLNIIDCSSLSFQEDDALIHLTLHYPDPPVDWRNWRTLFFYSMKMLSSLSATAVNLYRGITNYFKLSGNEVEDVRAFVSQINHPGPSITTLQRFFPPLSYENEIYHKNELLFHLKLLEKSEDALKIEFDNVTRYPVTVGIDEQALNQGTFLEGGNLCGLSRKLDIDDIKTIGLKNLAKHIAEENPYVSDVREYRLTDMRGIFCSNIFSAFECTALKSDSCTESLKNIVALSIQCLNCLKYDKKNCEYDKLNERCKNCSANGLRCISLSVFNVLWDMASPHKKTAANISKIDLMSTTTEFMSSKLFCIAFGGLHLCKACINSSRNHVLAYDGEHFGVNILWFMKNEDDKAAQILSTIKNAVLVGKDRQSDYLSYMTCCPVVQKALAEKGRYSLIKIPERIKTYTQNAKTQKRYILPTSIKCNKNGDVFILDSGAACVYVADRSIVSKVYSVGKYNPQKEYPQRQCNAKDVHFSRVLVDMAIYEDDVYIADHDRNEILIMNKCSFASRSVTCKISLLQIEGTLSISFCRRLLLVLRKTDHAQVVEGLTFVTSKNCLRLKYSVKFKFTPPQLIENLFTVDFNMNCFGTRLSDDNILVKVLDEDYIVGSIGTELTSAVIPTTNHDSIYTLTGDVVKKHSVIVKQNQLIVKKVEDISFKSVSSHLSAWGNVIYCLGKIASNLYVLEESGLLNFALRFCRSVNKFYDAITYIPPHGDQNIHLMQMSECITYVQDFLDLLSSMQLNLEEKFPTRKSFMGRDGIPFSDTINCIRETIDAWKSVCARMDFFSENLSKRIYPHTITNEALIERAFGYVMKKGQGHQQNMSEYIQSKRKVAMDFQMRMCSTPFNQYTKIKLRDKGYQHLHQNVKSELKLDDLFDLFMFAASDSPSSEVPEVEISYGTCIATDEQILKSAYLLTKSVPRRTNRAKWKQASGFQPDLLQYQTPCKLMKGDLFFFSLYDDSLVYLQVLNDSLLSDTDTSVQVRVLLEEKEKVIEVKSERLLTDEKGLILAVPDTFYTFKGGVVEFSDFALQIFDEATNKTKCTVYSDIDWATLCEAPDVDFSIHEMENLEDASQVPSGSGMKRKATPSTRETKKKKMMVVDDDDEEELEEDDDQNDDEEDNNDDHYNNPAVGDLAVINYVYKRKCLRYLGLVQNINAKLIVIQFLKTMGEKTFSIKEGDTDEVTIDHVYQLIRDGEFSVNNRKQYILKEPLGVDLDM